MKSKIIVLVIAVLVLLTWPYSVFAENFESGKVGSISVTLIEPKQNEPVVGAELDVYYVATVRMNADGKLIYNYTKEFNRFDTKIDDKSLSAKLDEFVSQHSLPSVRIITDVNGKALCENFPLGLYFIKQSGNVEGFAPCTPFTVTLPLEKNGKYVYEVNASPKTEIARLTSITIKKVWNTDASAEAADSITVQLLKNGKVVKTAKLDTKNDWQVTFADMPESDGYSVKEVEVPKGFTATVKQNGYVFTVTNTSTLIQTGQLIWPIPVLAVSGMLLIAAGIVILHKKRKTNA